MGRSGDEQMETRIVNLRLTCLDRPPARIGGVAVEFGLQDKLQELEPGVVVNEDGVQFDLTIQASETGGRPSIRFRGPFVHGPPTVPFLYLSLRPAGGPPNAWIKRLKISLAGIDWEQIEAASDAAHRLTATVSGLGSATVPLLDGGWNLATDEP